MLRIGGEEVMPSVGAQGVVIVVGVLRLQGRVNGRLAGIGDGRGRQPRVLIEVIGGICLHVRAGDGTGVVRQGIEQRRVNLQQAIGALAVAGTLQPVVDHGGDVAVVRAVRLFFDQGCDGDDIVQVVAPLLRLGKQIVVQLAVEVVQQTLEGPGGLTHVGVELIGVREEIALQPADVRGLIVDEVVVEVIVLGGVQQRLLRGHAVFRQQRDDLPDRVALRDSDSHRVGTHIAAGILHGHDHGPVVHLGGESIGAHADFLIGVGYGRKKAEEPLVIDEPRVVELVRHGPHGVVGRNFDGGLQRLFVESAQIRCQQPAHRGQQRRQQHHAHQIQHRVHPAAPAALASAPCLRVFSLAGPLALAHLLLIPAGGIPAFEICHAVLHSAPLPEPRSSRLKSAAENFFRSGSPAGRGA